jgi:hypothetical protein
MYDLQLLHKRREFSRDDNKLTFACNTNEHSQQISIPRDFSER